VGSGFVFVVVAGEGRHIVVMNAVAMEVSCHTEKPRDGTVRLLKGGVPIERQSVDVG
jgi:hypothetical protein